MINNPFDLKSKKVLVLGGFGLIGNTLINQLIDLKSNLTVLDIKKDYNKKNKPKYKYFFFDCTDFNNFEKNFIKILKNSKPDVFINCSYPFTKTWKDNTFEKIKYEYFSENINSQMNTSIWLTHLAAKYMKNLKIKGSVINIGSIYGIKAQDKNLYNNKFKEMNFTYSAIKGSLTNFTRQAAAYYGQYDIRINNVIAGGIKGHIAGKKNAQDLRFVRKYEQKTPLKRLGVPMDITGPIIFLASDASRYITGSNLVVDGGYTII